MMKNLGHFLLASICAVLAWAAAYWSNSLLLLLIDSNYHDGFAAFGGFVIGLLVAALVRQIVLTNAVNGSTGLPESCDAPDAEEDEPQENHDGEPSRRCLIVFCPIVLKQQDCKNES